MARKSQSLPRDSSDRYLRAGNPPLPTAGSRGGGDSEAVLSIALALGAILVFAVMLYMAS
jgi:hypothetical protein